MRSAGKVKQTADKLPQYAQVKRGESNKDNSMGGEGGKGGRGYPVIKHFN